MISMPLDEPTKKLPFNCNILRRDNGIHVVNN